VEVVPQIQVILVRQVVQVVDRLAQAQLEQEQQIKDLTVGLEIRDMAVAAVVPRQLGKHGTQPTRATVELVFQQT
jgi:hypothetical protein